MASGTIKKNADVVYNHTSKSAVDITAGVVNNVDFTTEINNMCPSGYEFLAFFYEGAVPHSTWVNGFVYLLNTYTDNQGTHTLNLFTTTSQPYTIYVGVLFKKV